MRRAAAAAPLALGIACCLALAGCAPTNSPRSTPSTAVSASASASPVSDYPRTVAARLQADVLSVTTSAAEGDPASALSRLDELTAALDDARAKHEVSAARFQSISESIALVRTDLEAAAAAQPRHGKSDKQGGPTHGKNH